MRDAVVMLVDGPMLAYTGLGEPAGSVVMYFHGAPTSRLDLVWHEDQFVRAGIRVVSADRPGYGRSSPQPADAALVGDQARAETLLATIAGSFRQGVGGLAADLAVQGRPWPFGPAASTATTIVLHGEQDPYVPVAHGRHTAEVIPGARFVLLHGQGHISLVHEIPQLCADLLAASKGPAR